MTNHKIHEAFEKHTGFPPEALTDSFQDFEAGWQAALANVVPNIDSLTRFDMDMDGSMEPSEIGIWVRYFDVVELAAAPSPSEES